MSLTLNWSRTVRSLPSVRSLTRPATRSAQVKLFTTAMKKINEYGVEKNIQSALQSANSDVARKMPSKGGVLVVVTVHEWKVPDINGFRAKNVRSSYVHGAFESPERAIEAYLNADRLEEAPSDGWKIERLFFWAASQHDFARPLIVP